jgi:acetoin utilization deacetylase AcuC-like enzyme
MSPEKIVYYNKDHANHKGWIDNEGKPWDVPERLFKVVDALLSDDSLNIDWMVSPEFHKETMDLISKVHSVDMIKAISDASKNATLNIPGKTFYDKDAEANTSLIYPGTFEQAIMSVECAVSAADSLINGETNLAITVSRPPGHHAGREFYHGFCYLNNAAVAAEAMKNNNKKVAILDIDVHHGDGTQDIFLNDPNVMYVSLHADPNLVMPGTGYSHEIGVGEGLERTVNLPFPIGIEANEYMNLLINAQEKIKGFGADYLIIEAGFDGHKNEYPNLPPITQLGDSEYREIGRHIGELNLPSLVVFSGGYNQDVTAPAFVSYIKGMEDSLLIDRPIVHTTDELIP